ncbi:MAG: aspartate kinase [Microscillaceae bacterium]|nr:aspartate kinase [Microscillaceae bacterium]MDW8460232.1 aspartate kinase [Cytophagales bacterium]
MKIMKFGGTSVGKPEMMRRVAQLITRDNQPKMVVLSALSGTTNALIAISQDLYEHKKQSAAEKIDKLYQHYQQFVELLYQNEKYKKEAQTKVREQFNQIHTLAATKKFTSVEERIMLAQGELLSTQMFALLCQELGIKSLLIPALEFMRIDADGEPDLTFIEQNLRKILASYEPFPIYITQGYICKNSNDEIDNLKRGGSDYTASLLGAALRSPAIEIWTDINGMHNNDPRIVKKTFPIAELSFEEAAELAYFGAKILHPTCIIPAQKYNIPVWLLNTMQPEAQGTVIKNLPNSSNKPDIRAIAAKDGITAINIKSSRMLLAYGFLRKIFEVFEKYKTPIDMITTSEVAVSLTIDNPAYLSEITLELKKFGQVQIDKQQTIICVVGNFKAEKSGVVAKVLQSLKEIPLRMVSYGGSDHNISILLDTQYKAIALNTLNESLFEWK